MILQIIERNTEEIYLGQLATLCDLYHNKSSLKERKGITNCGYSIRIKKTKEDEIIYHSVGFKRLDVRKHKQSYHSFNICIGKFYKKNHILYILLEFITLLKP